MTTTRPVQEFYSIGEVCALTDLKPHVLRYWESQFRFLNPAKNRSGNRVYKSREVELIMLVKHLLYTEKFTIDGARQRIDQYRRTGELRVVRPQGVRGRAGDRGPGRDRGGGEDPRRPPGRAARMNILVTNDDGILAPGLALLADVCREVGTVTVVAPDREQSGTSHSLTLHRPLRPARRPDGAWQIDGTPTDCVMLAIQALMPERPDFVFSGVNHGPNMGEDVLYSGTVAGRDGGRDPRRARASASRSPATSPRPWPPIATMLVQLVRQITSVPRLSRADAAQHQPARDPGLRGARASR